MTMFTKLEQAALHAIFLETPEFAGELNQQLEKTAVVTRENSGCGFFTTLAVPADALQVITPRVLGYATHARILGLEHSLGFVLFMGNGRMQLLEGYAWGPESTVALDFLNVTFEIFNAPITRIG